MPSTIDLSGYAQAFIKPNFVDTQNLPFMPKLRLRGATLDCNLKLAELKDENLTWRRQPGVTATVRLAAGLAHSAPAGAGATATNSAMSRRAEPSLARVPT